MKDRRSLLEYLSLQSEDAEAIPLLPIIEIAGDHRALIRMRNQMSCRSDQYQNRRKVSKGSR